MSDFCPRCEEFVALLDPHTDCKGFPWLNDVGIPGFDNAKITVSGLAPEIDRLFAMLSKGTER